MSAPSPSEANAPTATAPSFSAATPDSTNSAAQPLTRREAREREARAAQASAPAGRAPRRQLYDAAPARARTSRASTGPRTRRSTATGPTVPATTSIATIKPKAAAVKRRLLSQFATYGAMVGIGLIFISTTVPANAFVRPDAATESSVVTATGEPKTQELEVSAASVPAVTRDNYSVVSVVRQIQADYSGRVLDFTNNPSGTVQWPFSSAVPITSGFGARQVAGCGFCSTNHQGVDFTPGAGAPIQSIADGVVSKVEVSAGGLGNSVVIDHVINGQKVQSVYGHMQYGSIAVATGQEVEVGQLVGLVGSTGASTGAHLHLEIHLDGIPVDPFAWLQANAN
ncbi:M23 family metallopeptidase [Marisediminicola sp. LYQ134]|uniref:M23 family metallopeptidase n=1 Tax=unclassified Marisediminicola TaxID=2618316 RepID=UPI0039834E81